MPAFFQKNFWFTLSVLFTVILVWIFIYNKKNNVPVRQLPFFSKEKIKDRSDANYPALPDFDLTDQLGRSFTKKTLQGKIYVADYFFTTCGSICPVMSKQMKRVYDRFLNDSEVVFVSHTVNPETDSVPVLKAYADKMGISSDKWYFVTGNKKALYDLARNGYLLDPSQGKGDADDFIHTQNFALIDKNFRPRGYYDGTDSSDVDRLIIEINLLKQERCEK